MLTFSHTGRDSEQLGRPLQPPTSLYFAFGVAVGVAVGVAFEVAVGVGDGFGVTVALAGLAGAVEFAGIGVAFVGLDVEGSAVSFVGLGGAVEFVGSAVAFAGFGVTPTNEAVRIRTLSGHAMTDLAVPLAQFQAVGCVEQNCSQPDNTTSWSNLYCNGDQMLSASRCVVEDFTDKSGIHLALWMTGGNPKVVPAPTVRKHVWTDDSSGIQYNVVAVHTLDLDDEPAYDECPEKSQNGGYGSLVLPCYTTADVSGAINSD
ncbi:hypothetical protein ON010_g5075 [Phytophthora cinnamomi]|nr:hypothetical protein ON010_g5075 [Phytophthora cinnamomi]